MVIWASNNKQICLMFSDWGRSTLQLSIKNKKSILPVCSLKSTKTFFTVKTNKWANKPIENLFYYFILVWSHHPGTYSVQFEHWHFFTGIHLYTGTVQKKKTPFSSMCIFPGTPGLSLCGFVIPFFLSLPGKWK